MKKEFALLKKACLRFVEVAKQTKFKNTGIMASEKIIEFILSYIKEIEERLFVLLVVTVKGVSIAVHEKITKSMPAGF
jgi:uncharacterized Fe-S cluster-containing radical SAM superfamily protein